MKIESGGIFDIPAADYHADKLLPEWSLSSSGARQLLRTCPAQYFYERENPPEPTAALVIGSAAHEWLLEGDTWPQRHTVLPEDHDGRTKDGKALLAAIEAAGKRAIKASQFEEIKAMRDAVLADRLAAAAFSFGRPEQTLYWQDAYFGIWCRARPDWLPDRGPFVVDYKTTTALDDDSLRRTIAAYGYHQQAAWYLDGVRALGLCESPIFLFVFQIKTPPYLVRCVTLDEVALDFGSTLNSRAKAIFRACLRSGKWPGYPEEVATLGLPGWEIARLQRADEAGELDYTMGQGALE